MFCHKRRLIGPLVRIYLFFSGKFFAKKIESLCKHQNCFYRNFALKRLIWISHYQMFYTCDKCNYSAFCFRKFIWNSVTVNKWKSERPVSKTILRWKKLGIFTNIKSINESLLRFLKHDGKLIKIKFCKSYILQNFSLRYHL